MIKAIMFDLDGTLLPLNEDEFVKTYFGLLCKYVEPLGYKQEELIKAIWSGTKLMMQNDGKATNEQVFWKNFENFYNKEKLKDKTTFDKFYSTEFKKTKMACQKNPFARQIIDFCNKNFNYVILATNPIFPKQGVLTRLDFINLKENDFNFVCSYETCKYSKPNPNYFLDLLNKFNLKPEEVIMFGNNEVEDGVCASSIGIKTYMVGDYLIKDSNQKHNFTHLKLNQIIPLLQKYTEDNL